MKLTYIEECDAIIKDREKSLKAKLKDQETELKAMEKDGAKESDIKARQKVMDKEEASLRDRFDTEMDLVKRAWDEFRDLHPRKIIEDEALWREIMDRYQDYFTRWNWCRTQSRCLSTQSISIRKK